MYWFSVATVTNYHKFRGLIQHKFIICNSGDTKSGISFTWLKPRYCQGGIPSGGWRGEFISRLFPASRVCPPSLAPSPTSFRLLLSSSYLPPFHKTPVVTSGQSGYSRWYYHINIFNLLTSAKSLWPCEAMYSHILSLWLGYLLEPLFYQTQ